MTGVIFSGYTGANPNPAQAGREKTTARTELLRGCKHEIERKTTVHRKHAEDFGAALIIAKSPRRAQEISEISTLFHSPAPGLVAILQRAHRLLF
jgi:hypothetical protein